MGLEWEGVSHEIAGLQASFHQPLSHEIPYLSS
nr:MAG TPA: hypothetical protein [Caudoviricetes sp.]